MLAKYGPSLADWSVAKWDGKKLGKGRKLGKIALGAAEQSKRNLVPSIILFEKKADFLAQLDQFDRIVVAMKESAKRGGSYFDSVADRIRS